MPGAWSHHQQAMLYRRGLASCRNDIAGLSCISKSREKKAMWKKPEFVDLRLGLEVTLYISNR